MSFAYKAFVRIPDAIKRIILSIIVRKSCKSCGKSVYVGKGCRFSGIQNVVLGSDVHIGDDNVFLCTKASVVIGDHFMSGPNVLFISGNHRMDVLDKPMSFITDAEKNDSDDEPIIFKGDNWVGAGSIILKGVTIGVGAVIAAGSIVTKDVGDYCVVAGNPAKPIKNRENLYE